MSDLERQLTQLGREIDWPAPPDLFPEIRDQLAPRRVRRGPRRFRRSFAIAVAAMLILAGGVFAAVPSVRDSVLDFFGLRGATVERHDQLPPVPGSRLPDVGERTTLARARELLGFTPIVPRAAGAPDRVFADGTVPGGRLSLEYRPRRGLPEARSTRLGLLVDEFRGDLNPDYVGKMAGQATRIEPFELDGEHAIWVAGTPHFFFYRAPGNAFQERELRLAQNVLLLERGRLLVRLEGAFGKERAIKLARSLGGR
jgi:hypothetical protein